MSSRKQRLVFGAGLFMIAVLAFHRIDAATLRVPNDFVTPKAALAAARPGDRIEIGPGVYDEVLNLIDGVHFVGVGDETIFTQEIGVRGVREVSLARFRMHGGTNAHHFGIVVEDAEDVAIEDVSVDGFHHGISAERSTLDVRRVRIEGASDVALFVGNGSAGRLVAVEIVRNGAVGLLVSETDERITLEESRIEENVLVGMRVVNGGLLVRRTRIARNGTGIDVSSGDVDLGRRDDFGENAFIANVLLDASADRRVRVEAIGNYWVSPEGVFGPRISGRILVEPTLLQDPFDRRPVERHRLVLLRWADVKGDVSFRILRTSHDPKVGRVPRASGFRSSPPAR